MEMQVWFPHAVHEVGRADACQLCLVSKHRPCFHEIPESGWRHCLQLGQTSWAGLLFYTLRCLLLYLRPPSNPPLSNKYHYITGPNSDQLQSTAHGQHISPPFTLTRLCTCPTSTLHCSGTRFSVIVADLYAHSVAYHDGNSCWSIQCTLMEAVMMKPGWPDLFVDKHLQRSHRKYFHIDFLGSWHWRHRGLTL